VRQLLDWPAMVPTEIYETLSRARCAMRFGAIDENLSMRDTPSNSVGRLLTSGAERALGNSLTAVMLDLRRAVAMIHPECGPLLPDSRAQNASKFATLHNVPSGKEGWRGSESFEAYDSAAQNATARNHQGTSPAVTTLALMEVVVRMGASSDARLRSNILQVRRRISHWNRRHYS